MDAEWKAWQLMCREMQERFGIEVNDTGTDPLIMCIRLWGEELVALRSIQTPGIRAQLLQDAKDNLMSACTS